MKIRPLFNNILITPLEDEKVGSFFRPDSVKDEQYKARVVALGTGKYDHESGMYEPHQVKEGDVVLHKRWGVSSLKIDGVPHFVISEEDVLGIIEDD